MTQNEEPTIHAIHGIHPSRVPSTTKLAKFFKDRGHKVKLHSYGLAYALPSGAINWLNRRRAKKIAKDIKPGDSIIAHSNGAAIAYLIQKEFVKINLLILMQPALDNDVEFENTRQVLVVYNVKDNVVDGARFFGWASVWGDMGRVGYHGKSKNVTKWDSEEPPAGFPPYEGHSSFVDEDKLFFWGNGLVDWYENRKSI